LNVRLTALVCKRIIVAKSKEVKTGSNLEESSKEGCGSEKVVFPMMMIMMMTVVLYYINVLQIQD
jgi:hypothetical protein